MKAVMLAAGVARRLYGGDEEMPPKALLNFDGQTLLARHVDVLTRLGVAELLVVVGHQRAMLETELHRVAPAGFARTVFNPRYRESPIISLSRAGDVLRGGGPVLFMDADVYYHEDLLTRLVRRRGETCILMDRDFEPGDEPVKVCVRDGLLVDFGKNIVEVHDTVGEWPGFMLMSAEHARLIADQADEMVAGEMPGFTYEEAMCDVMKRFAPGAFTVEDITGIPWIEIDFPEDVVRAETEIRRRITDYTGGVESG